MKDAHPTPSVFQRWIVGIVGSLLGGLIVFWAWEASEMVLQFVFIVAAFALALLAVLTVAAWRHGFRWFFSRRALRFYGWLAVGIFSVLVLFYAEESWRGKRMWAGLQREAAARGESLELSSVIPPPVPEEENFALAPNMPLLLGYGASVTDASGRPLDQGAETLSLDYGRRGRDCPPAGNWALGEVTDLVAWQKFFRRHPLTNSAAAASTASALDGGVGPPDGLDPAFQVRFPVAPEPQTPAADVLLALSRYDTALAVLRAANQRPKVRYPIAYEDGLFGLHRRGYFEDTLHNAVSILCLRAVAQLAQDRSEAALEDTLLALRLADSLRQEPYDQLHRRRALMLRLCLQPVWEGMAAHRWKEAQLVTLQQRLGEEDLLAEFPLRVRGETLLMMNVADQLRAELEGRRSAWGDRSRDQEEARWMFRLLRFGYPRGWLYQDKAWTYRFYERRADVFKALATAAAGKGNAELRRVTDPFMLIFVVPKLKEVFHGSTEGALYLHTACQQAALACALERYRLAEGQYPESLAALAPTWLKEVPADLLDPNGGKLKYRREGDGGFVLYSIGLNRVDDGGKPGAAEQDWRWGQAAFPRLDEGDWVWRQGGR